MRHILTLLIVTFVMSLSADLALAGSADYASQRQSQEDSYENQIANKAMQDYYRNTPASAPKPSAATQKKKSRTSSSNLHKKTFGDSENSEVWGTKK